MNEDIDKLLNDYFKWLKDRTTLETLKNGHSKIVTPYLDRHNDALEIYVVKQPGGEYLLTDDGYTIADLLSCGCSLNTEKRIRLLNQTLNGFGICRDKETDALSIITDEKDFAPHKHALIQAMLAVNDLFFTSSSITASLFYEDVSKWLDDSDIRAVPDTRITGLSGFYHSFDFIIPKHREHPERMIQTLNHLNKNSVENLIFKWSDTKNSRQEGSRLYAFLNDEENSVSDTVVGALEKYEIIPVLWSKKEDVRSALAA